MVAYGKPMRPSLVDVMAEVNALDSELTKKLVLIVGYTGSVYPAPATLEHTDGTAVTYDELASIANTVVTAFDTHFGAAVLADIQKQIDDSIEIAYQTNRYDETAQAIVYDKVTVQLESGETPTANVDSDTFSGGSYTLPTASATQLGGVKVGNGLSIDSDGVLSASGELSPTPPIMWNFIADMSNAVNTLNFGTYDITSENAGLTKYIPYCTLCNNWKWPYFPIKGVAATRSVHDGFTENQEPYYYKYQEALVVSPTEIEIWFASGVTETYNLGSAINFLNANMCYLQFAYINEDDRYELRLVNNSAKNTPDEAISSMKNSYLEQYKHFYIGIKANN